MKGTTYFFILNPGSGGGRSRGLFPRVLEAARLRHVSFDYEVCQDLEHARALSRKANRAGYAVIVAVGGDGTINRVLNGFYDAAGKRISEACLGVLHTGTSPDFCRSYSIPRRLDQALTMLFDGGSKKVPVGKIVLARQLDPALDGKPVSDDGRFRTRYFACCANVGLGAAVARAANSGIRKWLGDGPGTFVSILKSLATFRQCCLSIVQDDAPSVIQKLVNLSVGKTFHVASGLKIRNDLQECDRRFYCLTVHDLGPAEVLPCLASLYGGKTITATRYAHLGYCETMHVLGNHLCPDVEYDGDPQGFLPCRIEAAADELDLIGTPA